MRFILPVVFVLFLFGDDNFPSVGVNALFLPPISSQRQQSLDSVKRHSYPMQHQSPHERYSSFSPSSDWYGGSETKYVPMSYQQQQQEERLTSQNDDFQPEPNEVLWMRQATMRDIPKLQECNRALLPENYPDRFYENYMRQFPDLTVIVESFSLEESSEDFLDRGWYDGPKSFSSSPPSSSSSSGKAARPVPVAYAMGCIREVPSPVKMTLSQYQQQQQQPWHHQNKRSITEEDDDFNGFYRPLVMSGHTISLAVMPSHRKMGLATKLLDYMHDAMEHRYGAEFCDLSVRMSNERAIRLYERHGYGVSERLPDYYKNGKLEDGFKMQKLLSENTSRSTGRINLPQQMFVYRPQEKLGSVAQW